LFPGGFQAGEQVAEPLGAGDPGSVHERGQPEQVRDAGQPGGAQPGGVQPGQPGPAGQRPDQRGGDVPAAGISCSQLLGDLVAGLEPAGEADAVRLLGAAPLR